MPFNLFRPATDVRRPSVRPATCQPIYGVDSDPGVSPLTPDGRSTFILRVQAESERTGWMPAGVGQVGPR